MADEEGTDENLTTTMEFSNLKASADQNVPNDEEDEELEEGELKDDDDDDDEDEDEDEEQDKMNGKRLLSKDTSDESDSNMKTRIDSRSSSPNKPSVSVVGEASGNEVKKSKPKTSSTRSSSPSTDHISRPLSFRSRHGSDSRHSSRSRSRSKRLHSPSNNNQQARLVTMRAKLLEAKSREIEMKFQKNKKSCLTSASPISSTISLTTPRYLKTTIASPPITYAENPNPVSPDLRKKPKVSKPKVSSKEKTKEKNKSAKKSSKKRKKKSSSSKKKKRSKRSETPKKHEISELKPATSNEIAFDSMDPHGPKTPPDNQVLTIDDEQVEWPSYLIKMTLTQPSISYSVNPDSVVGSNATEKPDTADLNADFIWYYNYFMTTYDMSKPQAQHQAYSIIVSSDCYGDDSLNRWLEQQGFSKQSDNRDYILQREINGDSTKECSSLPLRTNKPAFTILKSLKDLTLPNGKILPRGTIQKIVHPYPRPDRVIPDVTNSFFDLH